MVEIYPFKQFLLRRAAVADMKAAGALKEIAGRTGHWCETIEAACEDADKALSEAIERSSAVVANSQQERQRTLSVLESGDIEALMAERDRLALSLSLRGVATKRG